MPAQPTIVQQASSASTVAAPASFTTTAFAATAATSQLLALVALACSAAPSLGATTPATLTSTALTANAGNTLALKAFLITNAGGVTTIQFGGLSNVNGIAVAVYELGNLPTVANFDKQAATVVNSSTTPGQSQTPTTANELWIGCEADLTGQAFTNTSSASFIADTTATSTTGATNVVIRPFHALPGPAVPPGNLLAIQGTLAGALANGVLLTSLLTLNSALQAVGPGGQILVTGGAGYAVGV